MQSKKETKNLEKKEKDNIAIRYQDTYKIMHKVTSESNEKLEENDRKISACSLPMRKDIVPIQERYNIEIPKSKICQLM